MPLHEVVVIYISNFPELPLKDVSRGSRNLDRV